MVRSARIAESRAPAPLSATPSDSEGISSPPSASFSSDKENRGSSGSHSSRTEKRKQGLGESTPSGQPRAMGGDASNKRRRISERDELDHNTQRTHRRRLAEVNDTDFYDPDQDPEERRAIRKGLRDLAATLNDSRSEFLQPGSHGIRDTIDRANEYFKSVKQTSDATLDSRLLVSAADLSYKRTAHAVLGDSAAGIDVDQFVTKCIAFMRNGPTEDAPAPTSSQYRRRRPAGDAEDSDDEGDAYNWDYLGRRACFPHNLRPALSGFLLGPLSVQKRVRQMTQRRARQERLDPSQAAKPQELNEADLEKLETSNLTELCSKIRDTLIKTATKAEQRVNRELAQMDEAVVDEATPEVMSKYGISGNGGISLFRFCINPHSFGQTIENLFYISFLVRDGSLGVSMDDNDLPTLLPSEPSGPAEAKQRGLKKHQAVFSLDFETWERLIDVFDIKESMIPHRAEEENGQQTDGNRPAGWYT
ncbi:hypothetical protein AJ80_00584 [Polytolypa hystricis UAMH7299]|uniref:Non-structural maintenance of chromosomes element 4 n=1 Tax=Polytolypa hystricis (strain UAMH7299) TaxID=1447883 RepID=A0A2B7Z1I6_POLH7|nr:hypothetical protein AJ80_00584 [Polytolypa hystricis UAMH7299]